MRLGRPGSYLFCAALIVVLMWSHSVGSRNDCHELPFPQNAVSRWVVAENAMNGLCNQMFGIYSYIPVARLWNASIVVGNVYSRPSFDIAMQKYAGWNSIPFSTFFDYEHFATTWRKRGTDMILLDQYQQSCVKQRYTQYTITRDPHFWPNKDAVINAMLTKSAVPYPLPDHSVVQFDEKYPKFTALYNYWKGGLVNKLLLLRVHRSLRPAPALQRVIDAVLAVLPKTFHVAHLRLEGDYLLFEKVSFEKELELALAALTAHPCLREVARSADGRFVDPPPLYLASGLFNSSTLSSVGSSGEIEIDTVRVADGPAAVVVRRLQALGFRQLFCRESVLRYIGSSTAKTTTSRTASTAPSNAPSTAAAAAERDRADLLDHIAHLLPEQGALVDLSISRAAACFLSAHYASSFSYMAQRLRQLDHGQVLRYPEITEAGFGASAKFKQWGV